MSEILHQSHESGHQKSRGFTVPKLVRDTLNSTAGKMTGLLTLIGLTAGTIWHNGNTEKQFEHQQDQVEKVSRPEPLPLDVLEGLSSEEYENILEELQKFAEVFAREMTKGELHKMRDIVSRLKDDTEAIRDVAPLMELNSDLRKTGIGVSQILAKHPDALPHLIEITRDAFVRQEEDFKMQNQDMAADLLGTPAAGYEGTLKMLEERTMEANRFPVPSEDLLYSPAFHDAVKACAKAYLEQDAHLAGIREKQLMEFARKYASSPGENKQ